MHLRTLDLGQCSFRRPNAQVQAVAQATASYSSDLSCPALNSSIASVHSDYHCWFSSCSNLPICLSISLNDNLDLVAGQMSLIEHTLLQSLEQAQLWSQLGLRSRLVDTEWSSISHAANLTVNLSTTSNYVASDSLDSHHDAACVQPPLSVAVHRFNGICISVDLFRETSEDFFWRPLFRTHVQQEPQNNSSQSNPRMHQTAANWGCDQRSCKKITCRLQDRPFTGRCLFSQNLILKFAGDSRSSFAPSVFMPGHGRQLFCRARLIQPIARFLSAFRFRDAAPSVFQDCPPLLDGEMDLSNRDASNKDFMTREMITAQLWVLMSKVLAAEKPGHRLKPISFNGDTIKVRQNSLSPLEDILDDSIDEEDPKTLFWADNYSDDCSLFDIYSAQLLRTDKHKRPRLSQYERQYRMAESWQAITGGDEPCWETRLLNDHSGMATLLSMSEDDIGYPRERGCDDDMLKETTHLPDDCSHAYLEPLEVTETDGVGEPTAEWGKISSTSLSSMVVADTNSNISNPVHVDDDLHTMLDMQDLYSRDEHGSATGLLLGFLHSKAEDNGSMSEDTRNFATKSALIGSNTLQINCSGQTGALLTGIKCADGQDESVMTNKVEAEPIHGMPRTTETGAARWEMVFDRDMLNDNDQAYGGEMNDDSDDFMEIEYEPTYV